MAFPSLNTVLGQADREGLGGLSATNPETRVRTNDFELSAASLNKCFSGPYLVFSFFSLPLDHWLQNLIVHQNSLAHSLILLASIRKTHTCKFPLVLRKITFLGVTMELVHAETGLEYQPWERRYLKFLEKILHHPPSVFFFGP